MSKTFLFQATQLSQTILIQTIQLSKSIDFLHIQLNFKTVLFQAIQFCISKQFSSIWPIDRALSGATTSGQSEPGNNGNEGLLCIAQSSSITGTSPSDCLVSYPGHSLGWRYQSAEVQSVYFITPGTNLYLFDFVSTGWNNLNVYIIFYIHIYYRFEMKFFIILNLLIFTTIYHQDTLIA